MDVKKLSSRDVAIIESALRGRAYAEIARNHGISAERVRQILYRRLKEFLPVEYRELMAGNVGKPGNQYPTLAQLRAAYASA